MVIMMHIDAFRLIKGKTDRPEKVLTFEYDTDKDAFYYLEIESADKLYRCSVCGKVKPAHSFFKEGKVARTNCESCYLSPAKEMDELAVKYHNCYARSYDRFVQKINLIQDLKASITVGELIRHLQQFNPDATINCLSLPEFTTEKFDFGCKVESIDRVLFGCNSDCDYS